MAFRICSACSRLFPDQVIAPLCSKARKDISIMLVRRISMVLMTTMELKHRAMQTTMKLLRLQKPCSRMNRTVTRKQLQLLLK